MRQQIFKGSRFDSLFYDGTEGRRTYCRVQLGDGLIKVSYESDGEMVNYIGTEIEPGHFQLRAPKVSGEGTLRRFKDAKIFDCFWVQRGEKGMWRVYSCLTTPADVQDAAMLRSGFHRRSRRP